MFSRFQFMALASTLIVALCLFGCDAPKQDSASKINDKQASKTAASAKSAKVSQGLLEVVGGNEFNFGDIERGKSAVHTFVLKNVGKDVVHIKRAKGS